MCFMAVLLLRKMIDEELFAKILQELGYTVSIRRVGDRKIVEARRDRAEVRISLEGKAAEIRTSDYGPQCVKDYTAILRALDEADADPKVLHLASPYIYAYERKRGKTKRLLQALDIEVDEVYSNYCG